MSVYGRGGGLAQGRGWGSFNAVQCTAQCAEPLTPCPCRTAGPRAAPGRQDLEAAVQRLSAQQRRHSEERSFFDAERERKLWRLRDEDGSSGIPTPDGSVVSAGTTCSGGSEHTAASGFSLGSLSFLPDKLQIVKPLEGEEREGTSCSPGRARKVLCSQLCPSARLYPPSRLSDAPPLAAAGAARPGGDPGAASWGAH